jgi:hypothetical protein
MLCIIRPPLYMTSGLLPSSCSTAPYADEGIVHAIVKTMEHMSRRLHHIYVWAYLLEFFSLFLNTAMNKILIDMGENALS